jgi:hypothetical protein
MFLFLNIIELPTIRSTQGGERGEVVNGYDLVPQGKFSKNLLIKMQQNAKSFDTKNLGKLSSSLPPIFNPTQRSNVHHRSQNCKKNPFIL